MKKLTIYDELRDNRLLMVKRYLWGLESVTVDAVWEHCFKPFGVPKTLAVCRAISLLLINECDWEFTGYRPKVDGVQRKLYVPKAELSNLQTISQNLKSKKVHPTPDNPRLGSYVKFLPEIEAWLVGRQTTYIEEIIKVCLKSRDIDYDQWASRSIHTLLTEHLNWYKTGHRPRINGKQQFVYKRIVVPIDRKRFDDMI